MKLEFDPGIIGDVIFLELKARDERGDCALTTEYHSLTDPIYENFPLDERAAQFRRIDWDFFKKLGFLKLTKNGFDEFPELEGKVVGGVIAKARGPFEEGSDLVIKVPDEGNEQKRIIVRLLPDRFMDAGYLEKLLRHELMHVSDMLSESFGYRNERFGCNPMEESIIKERYSTFWDIFVDSRLIKKGKETVSDKDGRYREFESLFKKIPAEVKIAIFEVLWQDESLTHGKILGMSKDVNKVIKISEGLPAIKHIPKAKKTLLPGAQCPLCQFRTYDWVDNLNIEPHIVEIIRKDFPNWDPEDGACERCMEAYKVSSPVS